MGTGWRGFTISDVNLMKYGIWVFGRRRRLGATLGEKRGPCPDRSNSTKYEYRTEQDFY